MTKAQRSRAMSRVRGRSTGPELTARAAAKDLGRPFKANDGTLPGSPDLAFHGERLAVFVHGCFWHRHSCPAGQRRPATNAAFWADKFAANVKRDGRAARSLRAAGWRVAILRECAMRRDPTYARRRLSAALDNQT
jgi:DNA mismatch endonuclease, patch repair protein